MTTTPPVNPRAGGAKEGEPGRRRRAAEDERGASADGAGRRAPRSAAGGSNRTDVTPAAAPAAPAATSGSRPPSARPGASSGGSTRSAAPSGRRIFGYQRQRFEARKVRRLVRHVDPWSMLKLALLISLCMWLIGMIASVILWTVARNAGTIDSIEDLVNSSLSLQNWTLDGEFIFRQFGVLSLLGALGFTAAVVVASLVFNLVSDIIGGVWISVIEEETARPVSESKSAGRVG